MERSARRGGVRPHGPTRVMATVRPAGLGIILATALVARAVAQSPDAEVVPFLAVRDSIFVLRHVRVVDGTGTAPLDNQTVVVAGGRIASVGPAASTPIPTGARILDYAGYTVLPGFVGMHEHLYYTASVSHQVGPDGKLDEPGYLVTEIPTTAPRLYLAAGVTTARTTGSVEPYTDLKSSNASKPAACRGRTST